MAKKKSTKFKGESKEELKKSLASFEDSLMSLRFKSEGSKSKNVKESAAFRKQIARILTELNRISK
jgi:ribosomal protein L29